eukprot:353304-Chlamydomonas_euryale.AAC.13
MRTELMGDSDLVHARLRSRFSTAHPATDCLVGNWVGRTRWLMLDLTATAGVEWGPSLGGDGVVHDATVPRVANYFGGVADQQRSARRDARKSNAREKDAYRELLDDKSATLQKASKVGVGAPGKSESMES